VVDVHKPKTPQTWGELVSEIGIIVLGVLIALGAEQAVEILHWRHQVSEARIAMRGELTVSAGYAYSHRAIYKCNAEALGQLREALLKSGPAWKGRLMRYEALRWGWDTSAWRTALASGTLAHMDPGEVNNFASAYQFPQGFAEQEAHDQDDAAELGLLAYDLNLGDGTRGRMLAAVSRAERENWLIAVGAKQFLEQSAALGAAPLEAEKQKLDAQVAGADGACFARPKVG
jgi:hypothetical protein